MIVSENEAKEKWCHRTIGEIWVTCEASQCMAWVWDDGEWQGTTSSAALPKPDGDGWECKGPIYENSTVLRWSRTTPDRRGHCGLVHPK